MQTGGGGGGRHWYSSLFAQVLIGIVAGVAVGIAAPRFGTALKPVGDGFLRLIKMVIGLVVFCTVVSGMSAARDMKKVGRLGGKALIYFELVSGLALVFGAIVANVVHPGYALDARATAADSAALSGFVSQSRPDTVAGFLLAIVPNTVFEAFARGDILPIVFVSVLFGFVLSRVGERAAALRGLIEELGQVVFGIINFLMRFAPIGAFGAMAYTLGKFGLSSLGPLLGLIATFYLTCAAFVLGVLAAICGWCGFSILRLLRYLKEELLVTLGSGSSDVALPALMGKLETPGLFALGRRAGRAHRLRIQHRWDQHLHHSCRALRRPGDANRSEPHAAGRALRRGAAHVEGRQRNRRRRFHCAAGHAHRRAFRADFRSCAAVGNRPVHGHRTCARESHRQRCCDPCHGGQRGRARPVPDAGRAQRTRRGAQRLRQRADCADRRTPRTIRRAQWPRRRTARTGGLTPRTGRHAERTLRIQP